jgi:hypothetical protein
VPVNLLLSSPVLIYLLSTSSSFGLFIALLPGFVDWNKSRLSYPNSSYDNHLVFLMASVTLNCHRGHTETDKVDDEIGLDGPGDNIGPDTQPRRSYEYRINETDTVNGANGVSRVNEELGINGDYKTSHHSPKCSDVGAEPIAIIGMGMRLPGGIHDSQSFWDLLINKKDARCRVPADRYNVDAFYGPHKLGHVGMEYGYFLDDLDLRDLDVSFFSMTKTEVEALDPQQKQLLEVVYECLQKGGQVNYRGKTRKLLVYTALQVRVTLCSQTVCHMSTISKGQG